MDRRRFLLTSLAGAVAAPLAAEAQETGKVYRLGYVAPAAGRDVRLFLALGITAPTPPRGPRRTAGGRVLSEPDAVPGGAHRPHNV
jgi:hypothetical protein